MKINSFYPVIMSKNINISAQFFKEYFNFKETFANDWYISLKEKEGIELAIIDCLHDTIPTDYQHNCKGIILNFEVENIDQIYSLMASNVNISIIMKNKNEDFGQRHFIVKSPDEILIDIIQIIPPTEEYLSQYTDFNNQIK